MKTKAILFFVVCAVITLSFTFTRVRVSENTDSKAVKTTTDAPVGGIALEDK
jgi:hypothetical protein